MFSKSFLHSLQRHTVLRNSQKTTFWGYMLVHWEKYGEINISGVLVCFKYICAIVRVSPVLHFGPIHEYKPDRRHSI